MRTLWLFLILALVVVSSGCNRTEPPMTPTAIPQEKAVVAEIEESGGTVTTDRHAPDSPVLGVNFRSTVTAAELEHLKKLNRLEFLNFARSQVTDAELEHLQGLNQLQQLDLAYTAVTDAGLQHLKGLNKLRYLYLSGTNVSDTGLEHLQGLNQLQTLFLSTTKITDAGLEHLKGLKRLQTLFLNNNSGLTNQGVKKLREALPQCGIIY